MTKPRKKKIDRTILKAFYSRDAIKLQIEAILKGSELFREIVFETRQKGFYVFIIDGEENGFLSAKEAAEFIEPARA